MKKKILISGLGGSLFPYLNDKLIDIGLKFIMLIQTQN